MRNNKIIKSFAVLSAAFITTMVSSIGAQAAEGSVSNTDTNYVLAQANLINKKSNSII